MSVSNQLGWQFWVDRGGTFTDIVARDPQGVLRSHKLLSINPSQYDDAVVQGVRNLLGLAEGETIPEHTINVIRMGTTVATNALLEHDGEPLLLLTTMGFADALKIAYQQRPNLFALDVVLPTMLYSEVVEVKERILADGFVDCVLDIEAAKACLQSGWDRGLRSVAIALMHAYRYPQHEQQLIKLAQQVGFTQISASHQVSPLIRYITRANTTVIDAYLSPILRRYIDRLSEQLPSVPLLFMQSNGGLTKSDTFQGKDAILSGPAGGVVGMVETAKQAGFEQLIGFDMGGTSTDVCHYCGTYERQMESQIAGAQISAPMMRIHTVAAGGGSLLHYQQQRFQVGPDSAGAKPGPTAYRQGGALTVTDCNVLLGKLRPDYFPAIFGENGDQPLDVAAVTQAFGHFPHHSDKTNEELAEGFIQIAVENMANAIKKISVQRGYDVTNYTLCSFGGAGGQHACLVADSLGMKQIFLHDYSGVLSAYGMGLADIRQLQRQSIELSLDEKNQASLNASITQLQAQLGAVIAEQFYTQEGEQKVIHFVNTLHCYYQGSDSTLALIYNGQSVEVLREQFHRDHQQQFGFCFEQTDLVIATLEVEAIVNDGNKNNHQTADSSSPCKPAEALAHHSVYMNNQWQETAFYQQDDIATGQEIRAPAIILSPTATLVIEQGWQALRKHDYWVLEKEQKSDKAIAIGYELDPIQLEIFNNLFMSIAEQMGYVLENTAVSVNIKERLDFSCALFNAEGELVANAPHMPVHLGSMSESIKAVICHVNKDAGCMVAGDAFVLNDPYNGGTHLPDITVIRPIFKSDLEIEDENDTVVFYVASRGHHADIGGISPGSIPPNSKTIDEEGILINMVKLVSAGVFQQERITALLQSTDYPVRNLAYNLADLKAQLAACEKGYRELAKVVKQYSLTTVQAYMIYIQDNAEVAVRDIITVLNNGKFSYAMDNGSQIAVTITVNKAEKSAHIDFTGTSAQQDNNLNAPLAITKAAVLYVFRTLVRSSIPLNEGCLKPLRLTIPDGSMLNPQYPAAVVAGNVETSQAVVDCLYGALQIMGAAQGTMNNVTWGNEQYQYYETICGGAGATPSKQGADAVHTHMTNSRLTDPEVLEQRFPVVLESFSIRQGSGGKGRFRGGHGVVRKTRFLESMTVNLLTGHRRVPPYGMVGGGCGEVGENSLIRQDGGVEPLSFCEQIKVELGDALVIKTPGGGAYGER